MIKAVKAEPDSPEAVDRLGAQANAADKRTAQANAADKRTAQANARAAAAKARRAQEQYEALCEFYHVTPTIDKLK